MDLILTEEKLAAITELKCKGVGDVLELLKVAGCPAGCAICAQAPRGPEKIFTHEKIR
jgi:hypothetical protein